MSCGPRSPLPTSHVAKTNLHRWSLCVLLPPSCIPVCPSERGREPASPSWKEPALTQGEGRGPRGWSNKCPFYGYNRRFVLRWDFSKGKEFRQTLRLPVASLGGGHRPLHGPPMRRPAGMSRGCRQEPHDGSWEEAPPPSMCTGARMDPPALLEPRDSSRGLAVTMQKG